MKKFLYIIKEIILFLLSALFVTLLCNKLTGSDMPFFVSACAITAGWLIGDFIRYRSNKKRDRKIQEKLNG